MNLSGTIPMLRSVAHLGCNVFVSTSHSYLAIDCVVPTVGIWLSPTGVSAADLSVVISTLSYTCRRWETSRHCYYDL